MQGYTRLYCKQWMKLTRENSEFMIKSKNVRNQILCIIVLRLNSIARHLAQSESSLYDLATWFGSDQMSNCHICPAFPVHMVHKSAQSKSEWGLHRMQVLSSYTNKAVNVFWPWYLFPVELREKVNEPNIREILIFLLTAATFVFSLHGISWK